jgi:hypothetical protein
MKLYSCQGCRTTVSQMVLPKEYVQGLQNANQVIVGDVPSPMPFVQKADAISQMIF